MIIPFFLKRRKYNLIISNLMQKRAPPSVFRIYNVGFWYAEIRHHKSDFNAPLSIYRDLNFSNDNS